MVYAQRLILAIALLPLISGASPAIAGEDARSIAREHYEKGRKAFELGIYQKAIAEYMAAYEAKDDPAILYNLGQAHRLAGNASDAIHFYKMFLQKVPRTSNRTEVENKIAELEKLIAQQDKAKNLPPNLALKSGAAGPGEDSAPEVAAPPAASVAPQPVASAVAPRAEDPAVRRAARVKSIVGIAVASFGVAALAAGIGLGVAAKNASDDLSRLDQSHGNFNTSLEQSGVLYQSLSGAFLGIGAAALVAGGVVAVLGFRQGREAPPRRVQLVPAIGSRSAAAQLRLAF
jgi:tetratricopeptide (TPR) repeat protein